MMSNRMCISVIVPTFNRSNTLRNCIESLLNQTLDSTLYEIIIVDNNSTDATRETIHEYVGLQRYNIRYVLEPQPGLHYVRHAGAKAAHAAILAYTDDDAICDARWLEELLAVYADNEIGCAGGKIIIRWDREPPQWVIQYEKVLSALDYGPEPRILENNLYINGGNFSIRTQILRELGGFNPDQIGEVLVGDGEEGLCNKIYRAGIKMAWVPTAVVWHWQVVSKNATLQDLKRRFSNSGVSAAYGAYVEKRPTRPRLLCTAAISLYLAVGLRFVAFVARPNERANKCERELKAAFFLAKAIYELRLVFERRYRECATRQNWFE